jgi:hypothetical protein
MTTISDIARAADVSVESVLRVINRDNVSSDIAARVVAAMDAYGYGRLPRPESGPGQSTSEPPSARQEAGNAGAEGPSRRVVSGEVVKQGRERHVEPDDAIGRVREQLLQAVAEVVSELEGPDSLNQGSGALGLPPLANRMTVMDALFEQLAQDLESMKRELGRARSERLEDLTLLVDLITTSWRAVDQRLGRIDRKLERMEGLPEPSGGRGALSMGERRHGAGSPNFRHVSP